MADLTLWVDAFWISPYAFSSFVALEEKQLPYEVQEVAMHRAENRAPDYARRSLTARVPMPGHAVFFPPEPAPLPAFRDDLSPGTPRPLLGVGRRRPRARRGMVWGRGVLSPPREGPSPTPIFTEPATEPLSRAAERAAT